MWLRFGHRKEHGIRTNHNISIPVLSPLFFGVVFAFFHWFSFFWLSPWLSGGAEKPDDARVLWCALTTLVLPTPSVAEATGDGGARASKKSSSPASKPPAPAVAVPAPLVSAVPFQTVVVTREHATGSLQRVLGVKEAFHSVGFSFLSQDLAARASAALVSLFQDGQDVNAYTVGILWTVQKENSQGHAQIVRISKGTYLVQALTPWVPFVSFVALLGFYDTTVPPHLRKHVAVFLEAAAKRMDQRVVNPKFQWGGDDENQIIIKGNTRGDFVYYFFSMPVRQGI